MCPFVVYKEETGKSILWDTGSGLGSFIPEDMSQDNGVGSTSDYMWGALEVNRNLK